MQYITTNGTQIEYSISGTNCHVANSSDVHDNENKNEFVEFLVSNYPAFRERTMSSYVREWTAHNILFRFGIKPSSTQATDLNIKEYWWRRLGYFVICCLFKDKIPR